jgi:hypothetical protein
MFIAKLTKVKRVSEIDILEIRYITAILKNSNIKVNIPILKSYYIVVNDFIYKLK